MKAAAIYLRVSTDEQELVNQKPDCERLCAARGWHPLWFSEIESGARDDRPQWRAVLEHARRGELAAVVFWSIDRVGRNRVQVVHDLEELGRWKVAIVSHQESFLDMPAAGPIRETLIRWWAWMAQEERDKLITRTKAGLARARAEGKTLGRPRADGKKVLAALKLVAGGRSIGEAARLTGLPRSTVRTYMARNGYKPPAPNPAEGAES